MKTNAKTGEKRSSSGAATATSRMRLASGRDTAASSRSLERLVRRDDRHDRRGGLRVRNGSQAGRDLQDHAGRRREASEGEACAAAEDVPLGVEDDAGEIRRLQRPRRAGVLDLAVDLTGPVGLERARQDAQ